MKLKIVHEPTVESTEPIVELSLEESAFRKGGVVLMSTIDGKRSSIAWVSRDGIVDVSMLAYPFRLKTEDEDDSHRY